MKYLLLLLLFVSIIGQAQSPDKFSYQAVIRDSYAELVSNQSVGIRISILQGTTDGAEVFEQTQVTTTNTNGLISLEIGSDENDFSGIDWTAGPFFIKTETDIYGGTDYTITSITQLLSVPFALHAQSVESYDETDPDFNTWDKSTGIQITEEQIVDLQDYITTEEDGDASNEIQNLDEVLSESNDGGAQQIKNIADPTDDQDVATKAYVDVLILQLGDPSKLLNAGYTIQELLNAGHTVLELIDEGISYSDMLADGLTVSDLLDNGVSSSDLIGTYYQGGIIFYVNSNDGTGLVCAISDQGNTKIKKCDGDVITGADGTAIGTGYDNTLALEASCAEENTIAKWCTELEIDGYTDWYLPAKDELNRMYNNKEEIEETALSLGGTAFQDLYFTSTVFSSIHLWVQYFTDGFQSDYSESRGYENHYVRAIRAF